MNAQIKWTKKRRQYQIQMMICDAVIVAVSVLAALAAISSLIVNGSSYVTYALIGAFFFTAYITSPVDALKNIELYFQGKDNI